MSSFDVPTTQCVHIFENEIEQLKSCLPKSIGIDGLRCYLYGLWTHSSNVVIHLIVSTHEEYEHAEKHQLNCVGFVADTYSMHLYELVHGLTGISCNRQHIIVDVSKTKSPLRLFRSHPDVFLKRQNPLSEANLLQVNIMASESPCRKQFSKMYPGKELAVNGWEIESESDIRLRDSKVSNEKTMYGDQEIGKIDPNSWLIIRCIKLKIKSESLCKLLKETFQDPSLFILRFAHCDKIWQIEFKADENDEIWIDILAHSGLESAFQVCSHELLDTSQCIIDSIKKSCQCEICK